ncbi:MAG TPA: hypothetical protein VIX61_06720 [Casimicrobiaceae bacterium]|jgi:hypothetical protein
MRIETVLEDLQLEERELYRRDGGVIECAISNRRKYRPGSCAATKDDNGVLVRRNSRQINARRTTSRV